MKPHRLYLTLIILLGFAFTTLAQDQIIKTNDELIKCKVKEIGVNELKYTLPDYPSDVTFAIDKDKVRKVIFESGEEMTFHMDLNNPENYTENKKNAIKIDFLSPMTGNTTFAYEHSIRPGRSFEIGLGIIGLGGNVTHENVGGAFIRTGIKFLKSPDFYLRGMRYAHILKGSYIKPEISFGYYSYTDYEYDYSSSGPTKKTEDVFSGTLMINFGKQWVYDNSFLFDWFFGVGYGFDSQDYMGGYHYGYVVADAEFPISFAAGLKVGFLFK